jgi:hypothetical protein
MKREERLFLKYLVHLKDIRFENASCHSSLSLHLSLSLSLIFTFHSVAELSHKYEGEKVEASLNPPILLYPMT